MAEPRGYLFSSDESTATGAVLDQEEDLSAANTLRAESTVSSDLISMAPKPPNLKREEIIEESAAAIIPKIVVESPAAICVCVAPKHTNPKIESDDLDMRRVQEEFNDLKQILLEKMKGGNINGRGGSSKLKITVIVMSAVGLTLNVSSYLYSHYLMEKLGVFLMLVASLISIIHLWRDKIL